MHQSIPAVPSPPGNCGAFGRLVSPEGGALAKLIIIIRSDEGLTLETSAFQVFHAGNSTLINSFDKTRFLFHSPTDAVPQVLWKLEII